jgi:hypothetical protein
MEPSKLIEEQLDFWEGLAKLRDTYGLPSDIMWCKLRDTPLMPKSTNGQPMESEEFGKGLKQAIQMLQVGGWRKVFEEVRMMNTSRNYEH